MGAWVVGIYEAYEGLNALLDAEGLQVNGSVDTSIGGPTFVYSSTVEIRDFKLSTPNIVDYNLLYSANLFARKTDSASKEKNLSDLIDLVVKTFLNNFRSVDSVANLKPSDNNGNYVAFETDEEYISGGILKFEVLVRVRL